MKKIKYILTIAGSDPSAGAGIQSDLKTFKNHGLYGLSVITTITSQNTFGVQNSFFLRNTIVSSQLRSILSDFKVKVVKTGILGVGTAIRSVSSILKKIIGLKLIVDPVMMSKNKYYFMNDASIHFLKKYLMKITYLLTPNLFEAQHISGINIHNKETLEIAVKKLYSFGCKNVIIKGGHFDKKIGFKPGTDILYNGKKFLYFTSPFIRTRNTHGIGCTFSAAIASNLALGYNLNTSIVKAKKYIIRSLKNRVKIGVGIGPVEI